MMTLPSSAALAEETATLAEETVTYTPSISTDAVDYAPGATVTLTGAGFAAAEAVDVVVDDTSSKSWSLNSDPDPVTDETGAFEFKFALPTYFVSNYTVTATGAVSNTPAVTTFTDLAIGTYDQCSNDTGTGYSSGDTGCRWINGNLQSNNSRYFEGDATVQRVWLTEFAPGSTHTLTLKYGTTKGGKHAYDFLTTWDWSEDWVTLDDRCQTITGCTTTSETRLDIPQDPNVPDSFEPSAPGDRQFVMRGGTLTSATSPLLVSGTYGGDSETVITVTFTVSNSGGMCAAGGCGVALWFGAHVAAQANWGLGRGAGSISGSPYHVALDAVDGASVGQRDNQMQANVVTFVPNGTIIIVKDTIPNDAQDFGFNLTNGTTITQNFSLDDDPDATLANSQTFSVPPGMWTATETSGQGDWTLTNLVCVDPTTNSTVDLVNAKATINLASSETVTCTFTNTKTALTAADLKVTNTPTTTFERTYKWLIDKYVDEPRIDVAEGDTATFNYSVKISPNGFSDDKRTLAGEIAIYNPNPFDVPITDVTDAVVSGPECTVGDTPEKVGAGQTVTVNYSCPDPTSSASGINRATVTNPGEVTVITDGVPYTYRFASSNVADGNFSFTTPTTTVNTEITVVDDKTDPDNPIELGSWKWADGEHVFTYPLTIDDVEPGTCADYTNTATITETEQSDSQTVTVCVGKDLTVSKTAEASKGRAYKWLLDKSVDDTRIEIATGDTATFNYSVTVKPDGFIDSGYVLAGTITIANPNDWQDITLTDVSDTLDTGGTCTVTETKPYVVPRAHSLTLHYTCDTDGTTTRNTATATWDKDVYATPTGSASDDADVVFAVGPETNKTITVVDDQTDPDGRIELGTWNWADGEHVFTYPLAFGGVAGTCTNYTNTATIEETAQSDSQTVTVCVGKDLTLTKTAAGTFGRTYLWEIDKSADKTLVNIAEGGSYTFTYTVDVRQSGVSDAGWTLGGTITVSNPNDWQAITLTGLTDVVDNGGTCTVDPPADGEYVIPKNGTLDIGYNCTYTSAPDSYSGTNTATATWDQATAFTPNGSADGTADFTLSQLGTTNNTVHVTDSYAGDLGTVTATDGAPFATATFTYDRTESGVAGTCTTYDNTATITETQQTAGKSVELCVGKDLSLTKTATGTFVRTYLWEITKEASDPKIEIAAGGTGTFNYTVAVRQTGFSDSAWTASGTITVTNPNDWQDITLTGLSDVVDNAQDNDGTCTVDPGPYKILAGKSLTVGYLCAYGNAPTTYSGTNTATATWDQATAFTPTGTASGTADLTLKDPTQINKTVNVTDTYAGDLGTVTATDSAPYATATFTYDRTESGVAGTCTAYDNTATITETQQTANKTVELCVGKDLTVTKTATGTFNRTYLWEIDKSVDPHSAQLLTGQAAEFNYTVQVSQTGITDSGWEVSGTITVSNPNDWQAITLTGLTDVVDNGGTCTVDPPADGEYVIPKNGTLDIGYSCTYTSAPDSYSGTNTATATWDQATAFTPNGTASGTATFQLTQKGAENQTVYIGDDKTTTTVEVLNDNQTGTNRLVAADAEPWTTFTATYSLTIPAPGIGCKVYKNTAGVYADDKLTTSIVSDSENVTVCLTGAVTNSSLCLFDAVPTTPERDFRLLYTQETASTFKLNASNPGQFYMNGFFDVKGGETITFTIPYPFVSQGAVPMHVYDAAKVTYYKDPSTGLSCINPGGAELGNSNTLYSTGLPIKWTGYGSQKEASITIPGSFSGTVYVNLHLDYGLKGTSGWTRSTTQSMTDVAVSTSTPNWGTILNPQDYDFMGVRDSDGDSMIEDTVQSINVFKKFPGFAGKTQRKTPFEGLEPMANQTIEIYQGTKKLGTVTADNDGYWMYAYKYTGKPTTFTVKWPAKSLSTSVTMKSNGFYYADMVAPS